ncbi:MAG TPA: hypothetical protein VHY83_04015 [Solirubrobacteraceae bacterium]|jgi:hypothetical protein|nr:hypothetical protein [Solirubrobacteraceae bacterium]
MERELQGRVAKNETLFREVNEAIERGQYPGEQDSPTAFRCECASLDCNDLISLTPREYERVRSEPRRFVLRPGHEIAEVESIVSTGDGYVVVEKRDEAGRLAEASDPRS